MYFTGTLSMLIVCSWYVFETQACCNSKSLYQQMKQDKIPSPATTAVVSGSNSEQTALNINYDRYENEVSLVTEKFPQQTGELEGRNTTKVSIPDILEATSLKEYDNSQGAATANITQQEDERFTPNDLDNLRLEYNKYKILSHLSLTVNPDQLSPSISKDIRSELTSSTQFNENKEIEASGSGRRSKRSLACNQVKSDKDACCLETFYVNFTEIGWDKWILYPAGYNANYCRGQCDLSNTRYYHSTLLSKFSNVIGLCCSPKRMAPLRLLFIDEENKVHQKSMPDMVVESCDCA